MVPVKFPLISRASAVACGLSPRGSSPGPTGWPVVWLALPFPGRISVLGTARTCRAHCAPVGSFPPGGTVRKSVAGPSLAGADDGDRDGTGAGGGAEQPARASATVISSAPAETR